MEFTQLNESSCKTYFVGDTESKEAALIDPLIASVDDYVKHIESGGWKLRYVIDTHTHADHISGGVLLRERTGASYVMHKKSGTGRPDERMTDGSALALGSLRIEAIETPGHTKDSVSLQLPGMILTGDWLFIGGAGRTDLPGGDAGEHWDSLSRVIPTLDENTVIFPGHDYSSHTHSPLCDEKKTNVNLHERSREDYVSWLATMKQPTPGWMIETVRANNAGVTDPSVNFMPEGAESACMCQPAPATAIPSITVDEVKAAIETEGQRLLLDVRQPDEYVGPMGHVPGAVLIPLGELPNRLDEIEGYKDKTVIAICRSGGRSAQATNILLDAGFSNVLNMTGGTLAWSAKHFPVER